MDTSHLSCLNPRHLELCEGLLGSEGGLEDLGVAIPGDVADVRRTRARAGRVAGAVRLGRPRRFQGVAQMLLGILAVCPPVLLPQPSLGLRSYVGELKCGRFFELLLPILGSESRRLGHRLQDVMMAGSQGCSPTVLILLITAEFSKRGLCFAQ